MCTISKIWTGSRIQSLGAVGSWSAAGTSSRELVLELSVTVTSDSGSGSGRRAAPLSCSHSHSSLLT